MIRTEDNAYHVLLALSDGEKRFSELLKEIKKASLSIELNRLEKIRYISRRVDVNAKPSVAYYGITKLGKEYLEKQAESRIPRLTVEIERLKKVVPNSVKELKLRI